MQVRKAQPGERPRKLYDGGGLFLLVKPGGSRLWRMRYEIDGREKLLSFGPYPEVTLAAARLARDDARGELRAGRDPSLTKAARRASASNHDSTFAAMAKAWHTRQAGIWTARHGADVMESLERHVLPALGRLPVGDITPPMVLSVLHAIERQGSNETAHRVRQRVSGVFLYAIATGAAQTDPAGLVKGALRPVVRGRQPALIEIDQAREMLAAVEAMPAHPVTRLAHRMLALTAVRPGEVHGAAWAEIEGDVWRIPAARMKMRQGHDVPLSRQALDVVEAVRTLTGAGPLLFPNARWAHRPMSENALGYLLARAGYAGRHVPHGWRSTFSSTMNERRRGDREVIDQMLSHAPKDRVEAAYNRAAHAALRREIAQEWADLLLRDAAPAAELLAGASR